MMTHDMNILREWFKANQLSLNITKTNLMLFWQKGKNLDISMDGFITPQVHQSCFLGAMLNDELTWTPHINHIREKLRANKHLIQLERSFLNFTSLLNVYYTHIYSHLTYSLLT